MGEVNSLWIYFVFHSHNHFRYSSFATCKRCVNPGPGLGNLPRVLDLPGGIGLMGSGIAIILKIRPEFIATILGGMIFIWFIILHIPRVISSPVTDLEGEITSAFLALAYSGIAFVIAGASKR